MLLNHLIDPGILNKIDADKEKFLIQGNLDELRIDGNRVRSQTEGRKRRQVLNHGEEPVFVGTPLQDGVTDDEVDPPGKRSNKAGQQLRQRVTSANLF